MQAATIIGGVVGVALLLSKFWPNQPQTRPRSTRPDVQLAQPAPPTIPTLKKTWLPDFIIYYISQTRSTDGLKCYLLHVNTATLREEINGKILTATYLKRVIMVSQSTGAGEYFIFGMYVYEFGPACGIPENDNRVYIGYLDATGLDVGKPTYYWDIVNAYLEFASALGYKQAHIWSCPPRDETHNYYIFRNAKDKTIRSSDELNEWYKKLLHHGRWEYDIHYDVNEGERRWPLFPGDIKKQIKKSKAPGGSLGGQAIFEVDLTTGTWHGGYEEDVEYATTRASKHTTLANAPQLSFDTWRRGIASTKILFDNVSIKATWVNNGRLSVKEWF